MWMVDDCSDGRISQGRSHSGNVADEVVLKLKGKRLYQLQKFLEEEIVKGGDFFRVRWMVVMSEELRQAISEFNNCETPLQTHMHSST